MEGHEVPKNVSDFEFHLVGDMTLKQFAYLATGLASAYLTFIIIGSSVPILAWPLMFLFAGLGAAYAFLPILERPLDHWTLSFFKAIFTPTQRSWQSKLVSVQSPEFKNRFNIYLSSIPDVPSTSEAIVTKSSVLPRFTQDSKIKTEPQIQPTPTPTPTPKISMPVPSTEEKPLVTPQPPQTAPSQTTPQVNIPANLPTKGELQASVELAKEKQILQNQLIREQKVLSYFREKAATPGSNPALYSNQRNESQKNIDQINQKIIKISHELAVLAGTPAPQTTQNKIVVPQAPGVSEIKITLTSIPNVINGIVNDSHGNYLEGVVVVTHDRQGLPVRALKTNKLGQFLAATPLPNGTYTITLEKDNLNFDVYEITLNGGILAPLKISAKKQILT